MALFNVNIGPLTTERWFSFILALCIEDLPAIFSCFDLWYSSTTTIQLDKWNVGGTCKNVEISLKCLWLSSQYGDSAGLMEIFRIFGPKSSSSHSPFTKHLTVKVYRVHGAHSQRISLKFWKAPDSLRLCSWFPQEKVWIAQNSQSSSFVSQKKNCQRSRKARRSQQFCFKHEALTLAKGRIMVI